MTGWMIHMCIYSGDSGYPLSELDEDAPVFLDRDKAQAHCDEINDALVAKTLAEREHTYRRRMAAYQSATERQRTERALGITTGRLEPVRPDPPCTGIKIPEALEGWRTIEAIGVVA